ncbi:hypothetical protein MCOR23_000994 [Pyricularia oryzae]|nr:hypothetical protein MCOR23_000994 [Pyricularia oryzae]
MPDKIEDMYRQMWSKLAKDQRDPRPARAALYFKMCMIEKDHSQQYFLNLLLVALGSTDHKLHLPAFEDNLIDRLGSLLGTCEFIEENIDNDSLGFIDRVYRGEEEAMLFRMHREGYMETIAFGPVNLVWGNETHKGCEELIRYANDDMVFRFVHRSVYDFLTDTEEGTRLLERCQLSIEDIHEKLIEALKCWEPTSWIKDLPAFASLEKVAMSQDGIASQHKTAESPVQPLILVNKRIHDLHEVERYYEG